MVRGDHPAGNQPQSRAIIARSHQTAIKRRSDGDPIAITQELAAPVALFYRPSDKSLPRDEDMLPVGFRLLETGKGGGLKRPTSPTPRRLSVTPRTVAALPSPAKPSPNRSAEPKQPAAGGGKGGAKRPKKDEETEEARGSRSDHHPITI